MVDDLGWQDTSLPLEDEPTEFNRRYRTPNVEALAARGLAFTDAYAYAYASAPVCTPTRVSLMTGQAPGRHHVTWGILRANEDRSNNHPTLTPPDWRMNGLQPGEVTLPGLLRDAGYRTIHVGKAHLGAKGTPGEDPTNLGFDVNVAGHGAVGHVHTPSSLGADDARLPWAHLRHRRHFHSSLDPESRHNHASACGAITCTGSPN